MLTLVWLSPSSLVATIFTPYISSGRQSIPFNPFTLQSSSLALRGPGIHSAAGVSTLNSGFPTPQTLFALVLVQLPCLFVGRQGIKAGLERAQSVKYLLRKQEDLNLGPQHLWKSPQTPPPQYTHIRTSHEEFRILSHASLNKFYQGPPKLFS